MPDIALAYDQVNRRCDVQFAGRDFVLDQTTASAMLFSLFTARRARPDDRVPDAAAEWSAPPSFVARGGWCGDCLDGEARLVGSRMWLLAREKETERTRERAESYVAEALDWLNVERSLAVQATVRWLDAPAGTLAIRARTGETTVQLNRSIG